MFHLQLKSPGSPRARSLPAFTVLLHIWVTGEGLCRIGPLADIYGPASPGFDDQDGRALGQWGERPGDISLGATADLDDHFPGAGRASRGHAEHADAADERGLRSQRQPLLLPRDS